MTKKWKILKWNKLLFFDHSKKNSRMWNEICQNSIFKSVRRMLCKRSKLQPARVPAPETSYEEYVKMSKKSRIVNRQKAHGKIHFQKYFGRGMNIVWWVSDWNISVFKDRFGDVDPINTKLYYDKIRQNAVDQASVWKAVFQLAQFRLP